MSENKGQYSIKIKMFFTVSQILFIFEDSSGSQLDN